MVTLIHIELRPEELDVPPPTAVCSSCSLHSSSCPCHCSCCPCHSSCSSCCSHAANGLLQLPEEMPLLMPL
ncbi:hypothetical protein FKM82_009539 [Ascaphus truei]